MSSFTSRLEVTPLDDGRRWELIRSFHYDIHFRDSGLRVVVPAGFITDFASVPRLFWSIVSPWGKHGKAAIIHDLLYQNKRYHKVFGNYWGFKHITRKEADDIFLEAMTVLGVKPWRRRIMYLAVRTFGWLAWKLDTIVGRIGLSWLSGR